MVRKLLLCERKHMSLLTRRRCYHLLLSPERRGLTVAVKICEMMLIMLGNIQNTFVEIRHGAVTLFVFELYYEIYIY